MISVIIPVLNESERVLLLAAGITVAAALGRHWHDPAWRSGPDLRRDRPGTRSQTSEWICSEFNWFGRLNPMHGDIDAAEGKWRHSICQSSTRFSHALRIR